MIGACRTGFRIDPARSRDRFQWSLCKSPSFTENQGKYRASDDHTKLSVVNMRMITEKMFLEERIKMNIILQMKYLHRDSFALVKYEFLTLMIGTLARNSYSRVTVH